MGVLRLDHVAVAVRDPEPAVRLYGELLGGRYMQGRSDWKGFGFVQFEYPNGSRLEILFPASDSEGFLVKFLDRHGEGMHHVTFIVDDLPAEIARMRQAGYDVVGEDDSDPAWHEAFLSPRSAQGALVQLAWSPMGAEEQDRHWHDDLERILEVAAKQDGD
jgi:methylmalonyl-CoA/ethylmalonyl-CoA epimerase